MEATAQQTAWNENLIGQVVIDIDIAGASKLTYKDPKVELPPLHLPVLIKCFNTGKDKWNDNRPDIHYRLAMRVPVTKPVSPGRDWYWKSGAWLNDQDIVGWACFRPFDPFHL